LIEFYYDLFAFSFELGLLAGYLGLRPASSIIVSPRLAIECDLFGPLFLLISNPEFLTLPLK